jgi:hypothetical protein
LAVTPLRSDAISPAIGTILLVAITIILALFILLLFWIPPLTFDFSPVPSIIVITTIQNTDEITNQLNYDSRVILLHRGTLTYPNKNLKAKFFKNGQLVNANIETMNGHDFISTSHVGVQYMGGSGCSGTTWEPGEKIVIDFTDGTFRPGDNVQVDITDIITGKTLSRHIYRTVS